MTAGITLIITHTMNAMRKREKYINIGWNALSSLMDDVVVYGNDGSSVLEVDEGYSSYFYFIGKTHI